MSDATVLGTYDPQLLTPRDQMRNRVADTGPDFLIPDVTYDAQLGIHGDWRLATAAIALQLAGMYERDPSSFSLAGLFSVGFGNPGTALRKLAAELRAEVAAERHGAGMRSRSPEREDDGIAGEYTYRRRTRRERS